MRLTGTGRNGFYHQIIGCSHWPNEPFAWQVLRCRAAKGNEGQFGKRGASGKKPVHLVVRSRADIKQIFNYSPYPAVPSELQGYEGSQMGGTGTYRLSVDAQGAVTQVTILKAFTVTAVYDDRFSNSKGNPVPALDKVMVQALSRWRAKPGPTRVVDIYWSFGSWGLPTFETPRLCRYVFCLWGCHSDGERSSRTLLTSEDCLRNPRIHGNRLATNMCFR